MKFIRIISPVALCLLLGTGATVYGQHEEQAKPEKLEGKAQPQQRAQQPKPQAQPKQHAQPKQERAQQSKPQAQPKQERAQQPKPQAQPKQERAQQRKPQAQPKQERAQQVKQPAKAAQPRQQQRAQSRQPAQHQQPTVANKPAASAPGVQSNYTPPQRTRQQAQTWQRQTTWRQNGAWQEHASWQQDRSSNWGSDHRTWGQRGGYGGYYIPEASFSLHFGDDHWFRIGRQPIIVGGYPRFAYGGFTFMMVDPWPSNWAQDWYSADDVYVGYDNGYYLYNRQYPGEGIAITVML